MILLDKPMKSQSPEACRNYTAPSWLNFHINMEPIVACLDWSQSNFTVSDHHPGPSQVMSGLKYEI